MNTLIAAALAALLAIPALAQTPAPVAPTRPTPPPMATTPAPAAPRATTAPVPPPAAATTPAATPAAASGGKVDINTATEKQLDSLFGIGPVRAKAIIKGRPYADLNDLVKKKVLTQSVFDGAKANMALANINTSTAAQLEKTLPGIGDVRSKAIVAGRPYATPHDVVTKGVLTEALYDKIKDLVAF